MEQELLKKTGLGGYSRESVENYIKQLDTTCTEKTQEMEEKIKSLESELKDMTELKDSLQNSLALKNTEYDSLFNLYGKIKEELRVQHELVTKQQQSIEKLESENAEIICKIAHLPEMDKDLDFLAEEINTDINTAMESLQKKIDEFRNTYLK